MQTLPHSQLVRIVDGFYEEPEAIRALALSQEYVVPPSQSNAKAEGPIARRSPCNDEVSAKTLAKLRNWIPDDIERFVAEFRYTFQGTIKRQVCHADGVNFAGIVYLTPQNLCQGGTVFFRHRPTGDIIRQANKRYDFRNADEWEEVFRAEMAFNRLVFYPGDIFHAVATPYFGDSIENARLTQNLFVSTRATQS